MSIEIKTKSEREHQVVKIEKHKHFFVEEIVADCPDPAAAYHAWRLLSGDAHVPR